MSTMSLLRPLCYAAIRPSNISLSTAAARHVDGCGRGFNTSTLCRSESDARAESSVDTTHSGDVPIEPDSPVLTSETPFVQEPKQCILCKYKIQLDYKNPRLLSQFVSPMTDMIYDKHITGLCEKQQTILQREVRKSRLAMFMPKHYKSPKYNRDPELFNPSKPTRRNPY